MKRISMLLMLPGLLMGNPAWPAINPALLEEAYQALNIAETDLGFAKDLGKPWWANANICNLLHHPLDVFEVDDVLFESAYVGKAADLWAFQDDAISYKHFPSSFSNYQEFVFFPESVDERTARALNYVLSEFGAVQALLLESFAKVSPHARREIAGQVLFDLFSHQGNALTERFAEMGLGFGNAERRIMESQFLDPEPAACRIWAAVQGVDFVKLTQASDRCQKATDALLRMVSRDIVWPTTPVVVPTPFGNLIVGTESDDVYTGSACYIIDPAGNDVYGGSMGVANGFVGQPISVIYDFSGQDVYAGRSGLLGSGSAIFGISLIKDFDGDDCYVSEGAGQAAAMCGVAMLDDLGGDDVYAGESFCQAAAFAGIARLRDYQGTDDYCVGQAGQGYAGVMAIGMLFDAEGDDLYRAGFAARDTERHDERYQSLAQGFSIGLRPFLGGGIGVLLDGGGDDTYLADIFGQGASYWYGLGVLHDSGGNDDYEAYHYAQGSGIHLSVGYLFDESGDDTFRGAILTQGNAHDYAVGVLLNRSGNDVYIAESDSQGHGMNNGLGILVDQAGDDIYTAKNTDTCQGIGNSGGRRDYGCLGLLLDGAGADVFSVDVQEGVPLVRPLYGVIVDGGHSE